MGFHGSPMCLLTGNMYSYATQSSKPAEMIALAFCSLRHVYTIAAFLCDSWSADLSKATRQDRARAGSSMTHVCMLQCRTQCRHVCCHKLVSPMMFVMQDAVNIQHQ